MHHMASSFPLQISVPSDSTTYWCSAFELPANVQNQTRFITKVRASSVNYMHSCCS